LFVLEYVTVVVPVTVREDWIVLSKYFINVVGLVTVVEDLLLFDVVNAWLVLYLDTAGFVALYVVFVLEIIVDVDRWVVDVTSIFVLLCVGFSVNFWFVGRFVVCLECSVEFVVCVDRWVEDATFVFVLLCVGLSVNFCFVGRFVVCLECSVEFVVCVNWWVVDATSVFVELCVVPSVYFSLCFVGLGRFVVSPECPVEYVVCVGRPVVVSPEVEISVVGNSCVVVAEIK